MKLTKKTNADLAKAYQCAMKVSILDMHAPLRYMNQYVAEDIRGYGTAADEKVYSWKGYKRMIMAARQQSKGTSVKAKILTPYQPTFTDETTAHFQDEIRVHVGKEKEKHTINLWISTVFKLRNGRWQMVQFHSSMPDAGSSSEDTFHVKEAEKKLKELEHEVAQRTQELKIKNRELEIEAALERVRSKAMSMFKSTDLSDAASILFHELKVLGIASSRAGIGIISEEKHTAQFYSNAPAKNGNSLKLIGSISMKGHKEFENQYAHWKKKQNYFTSLSGKRLQSYAAYLSKGININRDWISTTAVHYGHWLMFRDGFLFAWNDRKYTADEIQLLDRFKSIVEITFRRYFDLQKAEAQAQESQIQLALERVRARTMAMQKSEELYDVAHLLHEQFKSLGQSTLQMTIGIANETEKLFDTSVTDWSGKGKAVFTKFKLPFNEPSLLKYIYIGWKADKPSLRIELKGERLKQWVAYRNKISGVNIKADKPRIITVAFFSQGFIAFSKHEACSTVTVQLLERFASVFNQTYTRFLDLQKAEAQAREARIEIALERVRARTMAMHKSDELKEVISLVLAEIRGLDILAEHAGFYIDYKMHDDMHIWLADPNIDPYFAILPYFDTPTWNSFLEAKANGTTLHTDRLDFKQKNKFYKSLFKLFSIPEEAQQFYMQCKGLAVSTVLLDTVGLYIENFSGIPYTEEENKILIRFGNVFQQTYTRFLDLQKAEAQAREAQIEAAMERVRARSMAMHDSEELSQVIQVVLDQFMDLKIPLAIANFALNIRENDDFDLWSAAAGQSTPFKIYIPYFDHPFFNYIKADKAAGLDFSVHSLTFEEKNRYFEHIFLHSPGVPDEFKQYIFSCSGFTQSTAYLNTFSLSICKYDSEPFSETENAILKRFAKVFDQAYIRFLDLQKAEAQAREAQIEAALERVRSRSVSMHKSEELSEVASVLFHQLQGLGINSLRRSAVNIMNEKEEIWECWYTSLHGDSFAHQVNMPIVGPSVVEALTLAWQKQELYIVELAGPPLMEFMQFLLSHGWKYAPGDSVPQKFTISGLPFSRGVVLTFTSEALQAAEIEILNRFSKVFEQTYTRFLDLQKAETQAREAQIEAALERVRSKTMAMHSSEDVGETVAAMFTEFVNLGIRTNRCGILIFNDETSAEVWTARANPEGKATLIIGKLFLHIHNLFTSVYRVWQNKEASNQYELIGDDLVSYYEAINNSKFYPTRFDLDKLPAKEFHSDFFFAEGAVFAFTNEPIAKESSITFKRFAGVFGQTYRRYLDLQKAETQAREAVKQSSLDRIRGEIASMRTTKDLERITPLIWKELNTLNIPFVRCGVFIMDQPLQQIHTFLSTPDGQAIAAFHLPYDSPGRTKEILTNWLKQEKYIEHWDETAFSQLGDQLVQQGAVASKEAYLKTVPQDGIYLHCLPFLQGMLYVGNPAKLKTDEIELIQSVADAFSTAYARYEDFNKLEAAKAQVDKTLIDLKQAQQQLVQSEKMASLGELTAGIAHEIQNPLNFVNNFSEVSNELIDEMKAELATGNWQLVTEIATDLKSNLEKINHHGKRADGIVKGMLQHSRASSGKKELTDINALCDEYVRLAYHGLRAKDKSFNAKFETHLDPTLPRVNVVAQDIGRVILNLINNAFYAVNEKFKVESQKSGINYEPTVTISTKSQGGKIEIRVSDNGNGIPDSIKEKIFQPFFTTKPTGQGTGLGLSLSYDIMKAHGGEIQVNSLANEGSELIITLPK